MWRARPARMRRDTQGHVAELRGPRRVQVAHKWRGHVAATTRVHVDARVAPHGKGAGK